MRYDLKLKMIEILKIVTRYGTLSSLEKVSSEETDDKTLNSSDEDYDCDDG